MSQPSPSPSADSQSKENGARAWFWMLVPVGLLVTSVSGWLVMVSIAVDDPGVSVEPDYYKKAADFDREIDQRVLNQELGWSVAVQQLQLAEDGTARLVLSAQDRAGAPLEDVSVVATAFFNARGKEVHQLSLREVEPGRYEGVIPRARVGLWEIRVRISGSASFTATLRTDLREAPFVPEALGS